MSPSSDTKTLHRGAAVSVDAHPADVGKKSSVAQAVKAAARPLIPTYHEIVPQPSPYLYAVTCDQFEDHLRECSSWLGAAAQETGLPQITFDDGHLSNYHFAFPLLEKYRQRAIFFVIAGWIGNRPEYMTWEQLREMSAAGHQVRSHGWSHAVLATCPASQLDDELRRSKQTIEDKLGVPVDSMSAPHGRWNRQVLARAAAAGYSRVYISNPWITTHRREGVEVLGRLMVRRTTDSRQLLRLHTLGDSSRSLLNTRYHAKELVRRVLGDKLYHRLWSRLASWTPETRS